MLRRKIAGLLAITAVLTTIAGCGGGDSLGGNVTQFKTSTATASAATPRLEADLITGNTCTAGVTSGGTIVTETVNFTISTVASTTKTLPLSITGYTVSFTPKNAGTPALGVLTSDYSVSSITPGSSVSIPVAVTTDLQKRDMILADGTLPCSLSIYQYDVTVRFHATEIGSGDGSKDIVAGMVMAMADRNNL